MKTSSKRAGISAGPKKIRNPSIFMDARDFLFTKVPFKVLPNLKAQNTRPRIFALGASKIIHMDTLFSRENNVYECFCGFGGMQKPLRSIYAIPVSSSYNS